MFNPGTLERYLDALLNGDRTRSRSVVEETLQSGVTAHNVYVELIWPVMVEIEKLTREDRITNVQENETTQDHYVRDQRNI